MVPTPTLSISTGAGGIVIQYANGVLESMPNLGGTWVPVPGAISPYTVNADAASQFYRVRQ